MVWLEVLSRVSDVSLFQKEELLGKYNLFFKQFLRGYIIEELIFDYSFYSILAYNNVEDVELSCVGFDDSLRSLGFVFSGFFQFLSFELYSRFRSFDEVGMFVFRCYNIYCFRIVKTNNEVLFEYGSLDFDVLEWFSYVRLFSVVNVRKGGYFDVVDRDFSKLEDLEQDVDLYVRMFQMVSFGCRILFMFLFIYDRLFVWDFKERLRKRVRVSPFFIGRYGYLMYSTIIRSFGELYLSYEVLGVGHDFSWNCSLWFFFKLMMSFRFFLFGDERELVFDGFHVSDRLKKEDLQLVVKGNNNCLVFVYFFGFLKFL